jgi:hypothetical protein
LLSPTVTWEGSKQFFGVTVRYDTPRGTGAATIDYFVAINITDPAKGSVCAQFDDAFKALLGAGRFKITPSLKDVATSMQTLVSTARTAPRQLVMSNAEVVADKSGRRLEVTVDVTQQEYENLLRVVYQTVVVGPSIKKHPALKNVEVWGGIPSNARIDKLIPVVQKDLIFKELDWVPLTAPDTWRRMASWRRWFAHNRKHQLALALGTAAAVASVAAVARRHRPKEEPSK